MERKKEDVLQDIVERVQSIIDSMDEFTVDEKIIQLEMISGDMAKITNPILQRAALAALVQMGLSDPDAYIKIQLFYESEESKQQQDSELIEGMEMEFESDDIEFISEEDEEDGTEL